MPTPFRVRQALRSATADWHDRVDRAFSSFDLTDASSYGRFLLAQAGAHIAVDAALEAGGVAAALDDWPERRRAHLLRDDLAALGLALPDVAAIPAFDGTPAMFGAVYVLEGSRLGGALLKRSVSPDLPASFLGAGDSAAWRRLLDLLDDKVRTADETTAATNAACRVFMLFERAAKSSESGTTLG
jgi:heme oxygenase